MGLFSSSALLIIKFQWMVVVWHPLYRSQKIHYWVLTHKCYKSIKKSTNKWQLISLLSLVFKKNGKEMNIHLEFYWKIRAISYSWSVFCFTWIFCRSFGLSICVLFSHVFEHCFGLSIVQMSEILWNLLFDWEEKKWFEGSRISKFKIKNKNVKWIWKEFRKKIIFCVFEGSSIEFHHFKYYNFSTAECITWKCDRFLNADRSAHCDNYYSIE